MILNQLVRYYEKLSNEVDAFTGKRKVPPYGYSAENISWIFVLSKTGEIVGTKPHMSVDKIPRPLPMEVPRPEKRTSGRKSNFLWDKTSYALGVTPNKDKTLAKEQPISFSKDDFNCFKEYHLGLFKDSEDISIRAFCAFLEKWDPNQFEQLDHYRDILGSNVAFQIDGSQEYLHECQAAQDKWLEVLKSQQSTDDHSICLISGKQTSVARLHPSIKGLQGGQSSGCSIVSFNKNSFTSYGKEQGENSPVSEYAAFAYTTALNYLLNRKNAHCLVVGDITTVFWAEANNTNDQGMLENIFAQSFFPTDDIQETKKVFDILEKISYGRELEECNSGIFNQTRFFVLGLAPNASRIVVRYWMDTTFGQLAKNLYDHWQDLKIEPSAWDNGKEPSVWLLMLQSAVQAKSENISPILAGEMMRAILTGANYPESLLAQLLCRIRTDRDLHRLPLRVAMIKAILQRQYRRGFFYKEIPMSLDLDNTHSAYLLGRLFAVCERIQYVSIGEVNVGVSEQYYASASTLPYSVFPRLLKLINFHLAKIRKEKVGAAVALEKQLREIVEKLPSDGLPKRLGLKEQGLFAIAYYQQREQFFKKSNDFNKAD